MKPRQGERRSVGVWDRRHPDNRKVARAPSRYGPVDRRAFARVDRRRGDRLDELLQLMESTTVKEWPARRGYGYSGKSGERIKTSQLHVVREFVKRLRG